MHIKSFIFGSLTGGAIVYAVTRIVLKKKYEQYANDQIHSVVEELNKKPVDVEEIHNKVMAKSEETTGTKNGEAYRDISSIKPPEEVTTAEDSYKGYFDSIKEEPLKNRNTPTPRSIAKNPQIISEEEFRYAQIENKRGYGFEDLTYYADGYVVDGHGDVMHSIYDTVGYDSLEILDSWNDSDPIHVRNDVDGMYYRIYPSLKEFAPDQEDVD